MGARIATPRYSVALRAVYHGVALRVNMIGSNPSEQEQSSYPSERGLKIRDTVAYTLTFPKKPIILNLKTNPNLCPSLPARICTVGIFLISNP